MNEIHSSRRERYLFQFVVEVFGSFILPFTGFLQRFELTFQTGHLFTRQIISKAFKFLLPNKYKDIDQKTVELPTLRVTALKHFIINMRAKGNKQTNRQTIPRN